jgi:hypothetical protein
MSGPPYLVIDPCGVYPSQIVRFLGRAGRSGVAVFSSYPRYVLWRDKWSRELGKHIVDTYVAPQAPSLRHLAARIDHDWPRLEGVVPWDEDSILIGAELSDLLGLGWNRLEVIERCRDKGVMKAWLRQHSDVRVNAARVVTNGHEALDFQRALGSWPVVVKPTGGAGSEHVFFPSDDGELLAACQRVLESGSGEVLLEEYIGGRELAVNGLVDARGDLLVTDVWLYDRRESHGIPNLYYQVDKLDSSDPMFWQLGQYAAAVVEALELRRAPIHMEVKVDDRGPCLIEVGARFGGGHLPMLASKLHGRRLSLPRAPGLASRGNRPPTVRRLRGQHRARGSGPRGAADSRGARGLGGALAPELRRFWDVALTGDARTLDHRPRLSSLGSAPDPCRRGSDRARR